MWIDLVWLRHSNHNACAVRHCIQLNKTNISDNACYIVWQRYIFQEIRTGNAFVKIDMISFIFLRIWCHLVFVLSCRLAGTHRR